MFHIGETLKIYYHKQFAPSLGSYFESKISNAMFTCGFFALTLINRIHVNTYKGEI